MTTKSAFKLLALVEADRITGPAKNLLEFARLARQGNEYGLPKVETTIATFCRGKQTSNQFIEAARASEIEVEIIDEGFRFDLKVIPQLRRLTENFTPDIIQTHSVKSHFLLRLSGLWRRFPWVAFHHGYTATDWKVNAYNYLDRWSLRQPEKVVTMNQVFLQELIKQGVAPDKITILHNSIKSEWLCEITKTDTEALKTQLGIAADEKMILTVGRLSREKGMLDLVKAISYLRKIQPRLKAKFVIVGDGPERANLKSLAIRLEVQDSLILTGQQHDVRAYYAAADFFVLPSHTEGSPNALLEAMSAQLPVVATMVGGVPEIVEHRHSALLVAPHNPTLLGEAVRELMGNEVLARELADQAHAKIASQYAPEKRVKRLIEIYRQISLKPSEPKIEAGLALQGFGKK